MANYSHFKFSTGGIENEERALEKNVSRTPISMRRYSLRLDLQLDPRF